MASAAHTITLAPPAKPWGGRAERRWNLNIVHRALGQRVGLDVNFADVDEAKAAAAAHLGYEPVWVELGPAFRAANPEEHCFS